jgi:hypothetical protein
MRGHPFKGFIFDGEDEKFYPEQARIGADSLVVSLPSSPPRPVRSNRVK